MCPSLSGKRGKCFWLQSAMAKSSGLKGSPQPLLIFELQSQHLIASAVGFWGKTKLVYNLLLSSKTYNMAVLPRAERRTMSRLANETFRMTLSVNNKEIEQSKLARGKLLWGLIRNLKV